MIDYFSDSPVLEVNRSHTVQFISYNYQS